MCHKNPSKRLEILDILNHPWFKNEKLNEEEIKEIKNKQKLKKVKTLKNDKNDKDETNDFAENLDINSNCNYNAKKLKTQKSTRREKELFDQRSISQSYKYADNRKSFGTVKIQRINSVNKEKKDMPTKVNSKYNQENLFGVNMHLIKMNNGKISNHMLPIGMAKDQKRKTEIIKNLLNQCYDPSIEANQNRIKSSLSKDTKSLNNFQVNFFNFK